LDTEDAFHIVGCDFHHRVLWRERIVVHEAWGDGSARPFGHELQAALHAHFCQVRMHTARESEGGLGWQVVLFGGAADVDEVPGRAFEQYICCALAARTNLAMRQLFFRVYFDAFCVEDFL
jgi:hypothetical protein